MNKRKIKQLILIVLLGIGTLFSLVVSVLAMIPVNTAVEIREEIKASSSAVSANEETAYITEVSGAIRNTTDRDLVVAKLEVPTVSLGGDNGPVVVFENITIPARGTITIAKTETGTVSCDRVGDIVATVGEETFYLRNPAEQAATVSLVPILFTLVLGYLLVYACRVYYYMILEERV
ncbi:MAG: hypothetical protein E7620_00760 [Ruminococcaceae bacterium]|nr:hypothetical protein [Oscillospiraceae bacterium]